MKVVEKLLDHGAELITFGAMITMALAIVPIV